MWVPFTAETPKRRTVPGTLGISECLMEEGTTLPASGGARAGLLSPALTTGVSQPGSLHLCSWHPCPPAQLPLLRPSGPLLCPGCAFSLHCALLVSLPRHQPQPAPCAGLRDVSFPPGPCRPQGGLSLQPGPRQRAPRELSSPGQGRGQGLVSPAWALEPDNQSSNPRAPQLSMISAACCVTSSWSLNHSELLSS